VSIKKNDCVIKFGESGYQLQIPQSHRIHLRSVLLTLLQAGLLSVQSVSSVLGISRAHCRQLSKKLTQNGVTQTLIDKRKGQKQDFRVDLSIKSELIKHFAARAVTGHSISSQALTQVINNSLNISVASRTIRWHMNKMGLTKIKKALPELAETLKKTA
jgi:biotin operon repressor